MRCGKGTRRERGQPELQRDVVRLVLENRGDLVVAVACVAASGRIDERSRATRREGQQPSRIPAVKPRCIAFPPRAARARSSTLRPEPSSTPSTRHVAPPAPISPRAPPARAAPRVDHLLPGHCVPPRASERDAHVTRVVDGDLSVVAVRDDHVCPARVDRVALACGGVDLGCGRHEAAVPGAGAACQQECDMLSGWECPIWVQGEAIGPGRGGIGISPASGPRGERQGRGK